MGMEHDVSEDPGSWIWARWRGFALLLVIWGRVTVGHHVEVTPRAAGLPLLCDHGRRGATWASGLRGLNPRRKPYARASAGISVPISDACYLTVRAVSDSLTACPETCPC